MPVASFRAEVANANLRRDRLTWWPDGRRDDARLQGVASVDLKPGFAFNVGEKVFTVGSCFARNIERRLGELGFDVITRVLSFTPEEADPKDWANILNKYNTPVMLNELAWALDPATPFPEDSLVEAEDGMWADLHLPNFCITGAREMVLGRRRKLEALYRRLPECRIVVVTLGMVEAWFDTRSGLYLNAPPPGPALRREPDRFELHVLSVKETADALEAMHGLLKRFGHPEFRIMLTVSPVPLKATFTGRDCLAANTYSKAALRAAAEEFAWAHAEVDYFPSYEMVTLTSREQAFDRDNIHVTRETVDVIMDRVMLKYAPGLFKPKAAMTPTEIAAARALIDGVIIAGDYARAASHLASLEANDAWKAAGYSEFEYRFELGRALVEKGRPVAAETHLKRALELEPGSAPALFHLGMARFARERLRDAEALLSQAAEADPRRGIYRLKHAWVLIKLRRYPEAERILQALAAADPEDEEARIMLERCRAMLERATGARARGAGVREGLLGRLAARVLAR
jgi:tetratricopeptide (TPR) repeat protein